ncbi:transposase [Desulfuromonas versatilis]|uniref:Transposase n=1 Tax=Desulfuromonas versatilis TaxID=2802975 RepID=A0ABM8I030_9BACT|nr:transposase [Desulfuromonas versatilis]BCR06713.1 transposase [Desulfuromonas versatilis]
MGNRRYDSDLKREAVRMVVEEGLGIREVERNLGITFGVLKGWVQKHQNHQDAAFSSRSAPESPEAELKRLRKENERLQRERDILKKAVAIFSTDPHRYSGS